MKWKIFDFCFSFFYGILHRRARVHEGRFESSRLSDSVNPKELALSSALSLSKLIRKRTTTLSLLLLLLLLLLLFLLPTSRAKPTVYILPSDHSLQKRRAFRVARLTLRERYCLLYLTLMRQLHMC